MRNTPEKADAELAAREAELLAGATVIPPLADPDTPAIDLSHLMEQPQVKAAIGAAVAEATAKIMAQLGAARAEVGTATAATDRSLAESLALKISELVDQGRPGQRRAVAPAILAQRHAAREAMTAAILNWRARGVLPEYECRSMCYLSEELVYPTFTGPDKREYATRFCWPAVPNEAMVPANEAAREIHKHFLDSIGHVPLPAPGDPLVEGFKVVTRPEMVPAGGTGQGGELRLVHRQAQHIVGTIHPAAPAPQQ